MPARRSGAFFVAKTIAFSSVEPVKPRSVEEKWNQSALLLILPIRNEGVAQTLLSCRRRVRPRRAEIQTLPWLMLFSQLTLARPPSLQPHLLDHRKTSRVESSQLRPMKRIEIIPPPISFRDLSEVLRWIS
jgi:hypothetical protein